MFLIFLKVKKKKHSNSTLRIYPKVTVTKTHKGLCARMFIMASVLIIMIMTAIMETMILHCVLSLSTMKATLPRCLMLFQLPGAGKGLAIVSPEKLRLCPRSNN